MIRAVIDTNILVSGLLSRHGNEALIVQAVHQRLLSPCLSVPIIAEYAGVLARPKFRFEADNIAALMAMLHQHGELFEPGAYDIFSPDPADTKFLHCALAAGAEVIVTGNKRDFPDSPYAGIQVVNAAELLDRITGGI